ncbi:MAG: radical SAM protein [Candidatus Gottesmanbacteria bacterium]
MNPYSGCLFNCLYCYIRGSKYGTNMAKTLSVKINAPEILEKELQKRAEKKEFGIITLSSSTDPYQPIEKELKITRKLLKVILKYKFPLEIATKSTLVLRDFDVLREIDKQAILPDELSKIDHGVIITCSISTLDEKLARILEPGAPSPRERMETIKKCKQKGFFVGINYIPVLPFISESDKQIEIMVKTAKDYGADFVFIGALTLFGKDPADCKTLYYEFLRKYYPELIQKYKSLYRIFFAPPKDYQKSLKEKAKVFCKKYSIAYGLL